MIFSCSSNEEKTEFPKKDEPLIEHKISDNNTAIEIQASFEKRQDSLRIKLFNSKPNENLKSSLLEELYLRGLVNQVGNQINFLLPFDLHSLDCGAPDCYSTDITFTIPAKKPVEFPNKIDFQLFEHGCTDKEILINGSFLFVEQSSKYINYYSKENKSNLLIGKNGELFYFPNARPDSIKIELLENIFAKTNEEDQNALIPYRSTIMTTAEYDRFLKNN